MLASGAALGGLSGNVGCSDFPPITTDPAFASSPGSPGRGIGGPGLGNSGAAPSNPSLNQPAGVGTQNPGADPLPGTPGTNGAGGGSPGTPGAGGGAVPGISGAGGAGNPGANGTFGAPAGSSHTMSAELDISEVDAASESDDPSMRDRDPDPARDPVFAPTAEEEPDASPSP